MTGSIKATVVRTLSDEEQVRFEGEFASVDDANAAVESHLALCRAHMVRLNEDVRAVDQKKREELESAIEAKGDELKALDQALAEKRLEAAKLDKKLTRGR